MMAAPKGATLELAPAEETGKVTLFDIGSAIRELETQLDQAEGLDDDGLTALLLQVLEDTEGQLADKAARILALMDEVAGRIDARKGYAKSFQTLNKQDEGKVQKLRRLLQRGMERAGKDELRTLLGNLFLAKPKLAIKEVDHQAAFEAGLGTVVLSKDATDAEQIKELVRLALAKQREGVQVTVTVECLTGNPMQAQVLRTLMTTICGNPKEQVQADEACILKLAQDDAEALAAHEAAVVAALDAGEEPPDRPALSLPIGVATVETVRTLSIRRA